MRRIFTLFTVLFIGMWSLQAQTFDVTFIVDMNDVTDTYTTPEVNGTFNGWCGGCAPMTDDDGDGIWEVTIALEAGFWEYKFAADTWAIQEELTEGSECTLTTDGFTNRTIDVSETTTLDTVCWASCDICAETVPTYNVLFKVDMSEVTDPFTTPEVNGTFNGWCGGCAPMADDDGDGVWELTIALEEGTYEYKYAYDSWAGDEALTEGDPCTVTADGFTNRSLEVTGDMEMDEVCWASCDECESLPNSIDGNVENNISVYPNPASDMLIVEGVEAGSIVLISNTLGQTVLTDMINNERATINVSALNAGTYIMQIQNEGIQSTRVIVIE